MATVDPIEYQTSRARSMPYRGAFYVAAFWTFAHMFFIAVTATAAVLFVIFHQSPMAKFYKYGVVGGSVMIGGTLLISYLKRRNALCPLCRGTPLINSGALVHKKSRCLRPLNQGYTAVLSIVFTQRFSCMYCGTKYDLLKEPAKKIRNSSYPGSRLP